MEIGTDFPRRGAVSYQCINIRSPPRVTSYTRQGSPDGGGQRSGTHKVRKRGRERRKERRRSGARGWKTKCRRRRKKWIKGNKKAEVKEAEQAGEGRRDGRDGI